MLGHSLAAFQQSLLNILARTVKEIRIFHMYDIELRSGIRGRRFARVLGIPIHPALGRASEFLLDMTMQCRSRFQLVFAQQFQPSSEYIQPYAIDLTGSVVRRIAGVSKEVLGHYNTRSTSLTVITLRSLHYCRTADEYAGDLISIVPQ